MRKKIILSLIAILICLIPSITLATECTTCNQGGPIGGGTGNASLGGKGGCGTGKCTWGVGGVRISLYSYDGSGNPIKVGSSVDIYSNTVFYTYNMIISKPSSDSGVIDRNGSECTLKNANFSSTFDAYRGDVWSKYVSENKVYQYNIYNTLREGKISEWLYNKNTGTGWLEDNVFSYMRENNFAAVASLFSTSEANLKKYLNDVYVVAELITQIKIPGGDDLGSGDLFYTGTVGQMSNTVVYNNLINRLYVPTSFGPIGKLTGPSSSYYLEEVSSGFYVNGGEGLFMVSKGGELCDKTYGMGIWYLKTCCPECVKSCENECGNLTETNKRACAIKYCKENENDNYSSCVNSCSKTSITEGCPSGQNGVCSTNNATGSRKCDVNSSTNQTLTSNVCYDDGTAYTVGDESFDGYKQLQIKYYKIECNETVNLFSLPSKQQILITKNETANLYLGYGLTYSKNCELNYKNSSGTGWVHEDNKDTDKYSSSNMLIKNDIATYKKYRDQAPANSDLYRIYNEAYNQLVKAYEMSKSRFTLVSALDYSNNKITTDGTVEIVDSTLSKTTKTDIKLEPVYCETGGSTVSNGSSSKAENSKCVLTEDEVYYDDETGRVVCGDNGIAKPTINESTSSYDYTVYYGLTSSWISAFNSNPGSVYHDKQQCLNAVNASNGYCIEKENVWVFNPFDETVSITGSVSQVTSGIYNIKIDNYGSCGQFEYSYECNYDLKNSGLCTDECIDKYNAGVISKSEYNACFKKYCSCDAYCGSNVACRAKYCPQECEGCDNTWKDTNQNEVCDDCVNTCNTEYTLNGTQNVNCKYDCCNTKCDGNDGCLYNCCKTRCDQKAALGLFAQEGMTKEAGYALCMQECECPNGNCGGDYYYRTIDQERPFPGGTGLTREPGANWYNKVKYITDSEVTNTIYTDKTNGKNSDFEYKVTLSSEDIKKIKNDKNVNTTYTQYNRSKTAKNGGVYCSYIVHDYLEDNNIKLDTGVSGVVGSGCRTN